MGLRHRFFTTIALALAAAAPGAAATDEWKPPPFFVDPGEGVIDGRAGVNVFPVRLRFGENHVFLDPVGLEGHLVSVTDPEVEIVHPAGSWFLPPPGFYRVWLEGGWRMSPWAGLIGAGGSGVPAGIAASMPVVGAGRVTLPATWRPAADEVFELLHAGSYLLWGSPRWEIYRRTPTSQVGEGLRLPEGPAVAAVWDRRRRELVAISRPLRVRAGMTTEARLERPQGSAHLFAELRRDRNLPPVDDFEIRVHLERGERRLPPDLQVTLADKAYAVWYDLEPGPAVLDAEQALGSAVRRHLVLAAGRIDREVCDLEPLPALDVALELPGPVRDGELTLELRRLPEGEVVERRTLDRDAVASRFVHLPRELLEVRLETRYGAFSEQADLRSGADEEVLLEPDLIEVRGTVFRGEAGHPAKLEFTTVAREATSVRTDEEGAYELVALRPLRSVTVTLDRPGAAPFVEVFWRPIAADRTFDVRFPEVDFTVRAVDDASGAGIPKAKVTVRNVFEAPEEDAERDPRGDAAGRGRDRERSVSQAAETGEDGLARLPPLRRGRVEIGAFADGYEPLPAPVVAEVFDERKGQEFEVRLRPIGATAALRLRLPDGRPAAGAEILLVESLAAVGPPYPARADGDGRASLPRDRAGAVLLARHPEAAFFVGSWDPVEGVDEVVADLPPAAGRRLALEVKDASGERPAVQAEIVLWVGGRRLSGLVLTWLLGGPPRTDRNGFWSAAALPAAPVAVLAWARAVRDAALAGQLDAQAVEIVFPWPEPVELRAIE